MFFLNKNKKEIFGLNKKNRGFNLLEMLVYLGIMTLILIVVVNALVVVVLVQRDVKNLRIIEHSAVTALDRIVREVKDSNSIDFALSNLGSHPGNLILNTTDENGMPKTLEFVLESNILRYREDGDLRGPLTDKNARVTNLIFHYVPSSAGYNIKIEMTIESGGGQSFQSENFYTSVSSRGF